MQVVNITEAKAHLSEFIRQIEDTPETEIIIGRAGKKIAKLVFYKEPQTELLGLLKGKMKIADDFDTWPDDIAISLEMK
jgi:antitoxin (DNA-binding transcriptional repressor) of toxin-antitoxin stability system